MIFSNKLGFILETVFSDTNALNKVLIKNSKPNLTN